MVGYKSTCPKWRFGQVGHWGKKTIWGFFDRNSRSKNHDFLWCGKKQILPNYI